MAAPSPFPFVDSLLASARERLKPPVWVVDEAQRRLVLAINHVLMREPQARERLARQKGRVLLAQWRDMNLRVAATPAGLFEIAPAVAAPDLTLTLPQTSPFEIAGALARGERPTVSIAGDVQFAAEINWLVDHVRWDVEEDLARVFGDAPAHAMASVGGRIAEALRAFVAGAGRVMGGRAPGDATGGTVPAPSAPTDGPKAGA